MLEEKGWGREMELKCVLAKGLFFPTELSPLFLMSFQSYDAMLTLHLQHGEGLSTPHPVACFSITVIPHALGPKGEVVHIDGLGEQ